MRGWSLRSRLFVLIVLPLVLVAGAAGTVRFVLAERISERLYDNTLLAVALTISRDVVLSEGDILAEQLLDSLSASLGDPVYYRIVGPDGRFVTGYSDAPSRPSDLSIEGGVPAFYDAEQFGHPLRVVVLKEFIAEPQIGGWVTVEVWQRVRQRERLSLLLVFQSLAIMGVVIFAAALLVWFGIRLGLKPLTELHEAVQQRSPDDLGPIRRAVPMEIRSLVAAMNALFTRLERAFEERDAFIADAAHQLRNPVAAMQAQSESLATARNEADLNLRIAALAETARRTSRLTRQLLTLEKARSGVSGRRRAVLELDRIAREVTARAAERLTSPSVEFEFSAAETPVRILGDGILIEEAIENLVENALRYGSRDGGRVSIAVTLEGDDAAVTVSDEGPGVPAELRERVFDRFFRATEDGIGGSGLGLPIARSIAEAHGGSLCLDETETGTRIVLRVPAAASACPADRR